MWRKLLGNGAMVGLRRERQPTPNALVEVVVQHAWLPNNRSQIISPLIIGGAGIGVNGASMRSALGRGLIAMSK